MPDNWKHRSEGMRCKTCMFFVPKVPQNNFIVAEEAACLGHPRRPVTASEVLKPSTTWAGAGAMPPRWAGGRWCSSTTGAATTSWTRKSYDLRLSRGRL